MSPLDSGTKTGKLVDRIIKELPPKTEVVKSNILDAEEMIPVTKMYKYVDEWHWTHLPVSDDIIVLLGAATQTIYKVHSRNIGKVIRAAHPASKWSHVDMNEYVLRVSKAIIKKLSTFRI